MTKLDLLDKKKLEQIKAELNELIYGKKNEYWEEAIPRGKEVLFELIGVFPRQLYQEYKQLEELYQLRGEQDKQLRIVKRKRS